MKKAWILITLLGSLMMAHAQTNEDKVGANEVATSATGTVTIASKGKDVRDVLTDLFAQAKKNFVIENTPRTELFLALNNIEFEETLQIICKVTNLQYELQNGIYYIFRTGSTRTGTGPMMPNTPQKVVGKLSDAVMKKKFTTRFNKTDFREVIKAISKQTDVTIEIEPSLQARMVDAYLVDTTLKQGLDMLTSALGLEYKFTDNMSIIIFKPNPNRITVVDRS